MKVRFNFLTLIVAALLLSSAQTAAGFQDVTGNRQASNATIDQHSFVVSTARLRTPRDSATVRESSLQVISIFTGCNGCEYQPVLSDNGNWRLAW